eukprot:TRINITY_DN39577_c0_g1_i4.p1 TRINITY_DN39577_c0_g1~~TRINITY_DN39577_c0_g1_i4.p1  ORF type:complete len:288 (+),score=50.45 TRINITY_DN39577_c0_g1_i4:78-866(+)
MGTGVCTLEEVRSSAASAGRQSCSQNWRTQICVCSAADSSDFSARPASAASAQAGSRTAPAAVSPARQPPPAARQPVPTKARPATAGSAAPSRGRGCFAVDIMYTPVNMPGHGRTMANKVEECQARCARTPGCARFTFWPAEGHCHLQEFNARSQPSEGAISGPASCEEEEELRELFNPTPPPARPVPPPPPPVAWPRPQDTPRNTYDDEDEHEYQERKRPAAAPPAPRAVQAAPAPLNEGHPFVLLLVFIAIAGAAVQLAP